MGRKKLGTDVFAEAVSRMLPLYENGHRVVVSFSAGKDSGVCLEVCIEAAKLAGRLPVDVVMRDEEIMFPGTFEYAERVYERKDEVNLVWLIASQPVINVFNRTQPYFWVFDPDVPEDEWVRKPPDYAYYHPHKDITRMVTPELFPPAEGKTIYSVIGLRVQESKGRMYGLFSSKGYLTKPNRLGIILARPIYDWSDGDVCKAHRDFGWDYNSAYDTMLKRGVPKKLMRIAPPTMNQRGVDLLRFARDSWPQWFDRVAHRCPGVRTAADYGSRAVIPTRKSGESWEDVFHRECIERAPEWIAERSREAERRLLGTHARHSTAPFPDIHPCDQCVGENGSWKNLANFLYCGDPFSVKMSFLPYVEPEFFKEGKGTWGGTPAFT